MRSLPLQRLLKREALSKYEDLNLRWETGSFAMGPSFFQVFTTQKQRKATKEVGAWARGPHVGLSGTYGGWWIFSGGTGVG